MTPRIAVVVPVKDGARYLAELLAALAREAVDEVLIIDSGSRDGSVEIARSAEVEVLEITPTDFGHGRTRNLGAAQTSTEIVAFLTQDATPVPGWRAAMLEAFELDPSIGVVFGPHLPRPATSPMIARELIEFFATFAGEGDAPRVFAPGDSTFLSNVDAAYRRACWEEIRFDDVPYSEDQAFGRALAAHSSWRKAYAPRAGVLHAHDYPPVEFMRRYFDEYRGLRETIGHVERLGIRSMVRDVRGLDGGRQALDARAGHVGGRGRRAGPADRSCITADARCFRLSGAAGAGCLSPSRACFRWRAARTAPPRRSSRRRVPRSYRRQPTRSLAKQRTATKRSPACSATGRRH